MVIHDQNKVLFSLSLVSVCVGEREKIHNTRLQKESLQQKNKAV